mmetsp:Transcript_19498/g.61890  ORF Transcript_19498/g.61890 Transcript_19498/m.61890 type:complete len:223 (+) Transcript_19498:230-898(+)
MPLHVSRAKPSSEATMASSSCSGTEDPRPPMKTVLEPSLAPSKPPPPRAALPSIGTGCDGGGGLAASGDGSSSSAVLLLAASRFGARPSDGRGAVDRLTKATMACSCVSYCAQARARGVPASFIVTATNPSWEPAKSSNSSCVVAWFRVPIKIVEASLAPLSATWAGCSCVRGRLSPMGGRAMRAGRSMTRGTATGGGLAGAVGWPGTCLKSCLASSTRSNA